MYNLVGISDSESAGMCGVCGDEDEPEDVCRVATLALDGVRDPSQLHMSGLR